MSINVWQNQGIDQFREVATRLASLLQTGSDPAGAVGQFAAATTAEEFTNLLIAYSGRWFHETSGQTALIAPELFWLLSEPDVTTTRAGLQDLGSGESSVGERSRKLLVICLYEVVAQGHWDSGVNRVPAMSNGSMHVLRAEG
jgi:hypothetical protein